MRRRFPLRSASGHLFPGEQRGGPFILLSLSRKTQVNDYRLGSIVSTTN